MGQILENNIRHLPDKLEHLNSECTCFEPGDNLFLVTYLNFSFLLRVYCKKKKLLKGKCCLSLPISTSFGICSKIILK